MKILWLFLIANYILLLRISWRPSWELRILCKKWSIAQISDALTIDIPEFSLQKSHHWFSCNLIVSMIRVHKHGNRKFFCFQFRSFTITTSTKSKCWFLKWHQKLEGMVYRISNIYAFLVYFFKFLRIVIACY